MSEGELFPGTGISQGGLPLSLSLHLFQPLLQPHPILSSLQSPYRLSRLNNRDSEVFRTLWRQRSMRCHSLSSDRSSDESFYAGEVAMTTTTTTTPIPIAMLKSLHQNLPAIARTPHHRHQTKPTHQYLRQIFSSFGNLSDLEKAGSNSRPQRDRQQDPGPSSRQTRLARKMRKS